MRLGANRIGQRGNSVQMWWHGRSDIQPTKPVGNRARGFTAGLGPPDRWVPFPDAGDDPFAQKAVGEVGRWLEGECHAGLLS